MAQNKLLNRFRNCIWRWTMTAILKMPDVIDARAQQGIEAEPGPPDLLSERIRGDVVKRRDVAVKAGIVGK
jgi:hypothetical protein